MYDPIGLSHDEYVASRRERDPEFGAAYDEARATMALALGLTDLRCHRNFSQRALAERSGIKQPMINRIERGSQVPRPITLLRLLAALNGVLTMRPDGTIHFRPVEKSSSVALSSSDVEDQGGNAPSENGSSAARGRPRSRS